MPTTTLPQAYPLETGREPVPTDTDMAEHIRTYSGFLKLLRWFVAHVFVMLLALYSFLIAHDGGLGLFLLLVAIAILIYGIVHRPAVQHDIAAAARHRDAPAPSH